MTGTTRRAHRRAAGDGVHFRPGYTPAYQPTGGASGLLPPPAAEAVLSHPQADVFSCPTRFRVLIAGRRFGKTYLACVELLARAMEKPGALCWYVGPTYRMAKDIAWEMLKAIVLPAWRLGEPNESDLSIRLKNGSRIALKGAEKWHRLKGRSLTFCVLDEFAQIPQLAWDEAIRPSLSDQQGDALFIGTPTGFNWAHTLYQQGQSADPKFHDWASFQFTTAQGGRVAPEEIAAAAATMDPRLFRQEYGASFETLLGRVYGSFLRKDIPVGNLDSTIRDRGGVLLVGMDFNVNPMTAVVGQKAPNGDLEVLAAIELADSSTEEMAAHLKKRWPNRRIAVCPDPSGKARKTSARAGETDFTILERAGFVLDAPSMAPLVRDRINNANALLCAADGRRRCRVHPDAAALVTAFDGLTWKHNVPDPKSPHIHVTDAFGYLAWQQFNQLAATAWGVSHFAA